MSKTILTVLLVLAAGLTGCSGSGGTDAPVDGDTQGIAEGDTKTVTGVILDIDSVALAEVNGFTLKAGDERYQVLIADDIDYDFPLGHLHEHLEGSLPVAVQIENRGGDLYALSIDDA